METGLILLALVAIVAYLVVRRMRKRRKAWEEHELERKAKADQRERDLEALRKAQAAQMVATMQLSGIAALAQAQAQQRAAEYANQAGQAAAQRQADLNRYQAQANAFSAPTPRPGTVMHISTANRDAETEQQRRRRFEAVEAATWDATHSGLGVVRTHYDDGGQIQMEHVPIAEFKGEGGTFDGGGASGDYARSDCQTSSPASTSDSGSSSSCGSSDSGSSSSD